MTKRKSPKIASKSSFGVRTYRGNPDTGVTVSDGGGLRILKGVRDGVGFAWGDPYEGSAPGQLGRASEEEQAKIREHFRRRVAAIDHLILAIASDALGQKDGERYYQRLKHRLRWSAKQPWSITSLDIRRHVEAIQQVETETAPLRRSHYARDVANEGGGGVIWDTDLEGRRITKSGS